MNDSTNQPPQPPSQPPYGQPPSQPPYGQPPQPFQYNPQQYGQPAYGQTQYGQPQYAPPPPYGAPPVPGYPPGYVPPPQQKSSLKWLWITLGIVGGLLVLGCAVCGIFVYTEVPRASSIIGPAFSVGEYYQYLKQQDYSKAYSLVDSNATFSVNGQTVPVTDSQAFTSAAQAVDTSAGSITKFSAQPNGSDLTHMTVTVTRSNRTYDVHLTLAQVGNAWKIVSADGI